MSPGALKEGAGGTAGSLRLILQSAIIDQAVLLGEGVRSDGTPMPWVLDCRQALLQPDPLHAATRLMMPILAVMQTDAVVGMTLGADALVAGIVNEAHHVGMAITGGIARPQAKRYGLRRELEGPPLSASSRVVVIDDVSNSGRTMLRVVEMLRGAGVENVICALSVIDLGGEAEVRLRAEGVPLISLFDRHSLGLGRWTGERRSVPEVRMIGADADVPFAYLVREGRPKATSVVTYSADGRLTQWHSNGRQRWSVNFPGPASQHAPLRPAEIAGSIIVACEDGLRAVEAHGVNRVEASRPLAVPEAGVRQIAGVKCGQSMTVLAVSQHAIAAIDFASWTVAWTLSCGDDLSWVSADPEVGVVVAGGGGRRLLGIDAWTGGDLWSAELSAAPVGAGSTGPAGRLHISTVDGLLWSIEVRSGAVSWVRRLGRALTLPPLVSNAELCVASGNRLIHLDPGRGQILAISGLPDSATGVRRCSRLGAPAAFVCGGEIAIHEGQRDGDVQVWDPGEQIIDLWLGPERRFYASTTAGHLLGGRVPATPRA